MFELFLISDKTEYIVLENMGRIAHVGIEVYFQHSLGVGSIKSPFKIFAASTLSAMLLAWWLTHGVTDPAGLTHDVPEQPCAPLLGYPSPLPTGPEAHMSLEPALYTRVYQEK